jgi:hypothetical protein
VVAKAELALFIAAPNKAAARNITDNGMARSSASSDESNFDALLEFGRGVNQLDFAEI